MSTYIYKYVYKTILVLKFTHNIQKRHQIELEAIRKDGNNVLAMIVEEHKVEICY